MQTLMPIFSDEPHRNFQRCRQSLRDDAQDFGRDYQNLFEVAIRFFYALLMKFVLMSSTAEAVLNDDD